MAVRAEGGDGSRRGQGSQQSSGATVTRTPVRPVGNSEGMAYYPRPYSDVTVNTSSLSGVADASDYGSDTWNAEVPQKDVATKWEFLDQDTKDWVTDVAKSVDYRGTGRSLWERAVNASELSVREGNPMTPWDFINNQVGDGKSRGKSDPRGVSGSGSGSGSGGTSMSMSYDNAPAFDVRAIADAVSMEMLGRGVEQGEMERILKRVRKYENRNPSVTRSQSGTGISVSRSSGGATNTGRQEVIERIIAKNPEFQDYQKATTMMDWFDQALSERLQTSG